MASQYSRTSQTPSRARQRAARWAMVLSFSLAACGPDALTQVAGVSATQTPQATDTPTLTSSPTTQPTVTPTATVVLTSTPTSTETPTLAPEVYKIEPASVLSVQAKVTGVETSFTIVIDKTLAERKIIPITELSFVDGFIDDKGHTPAESNAYAAYYGMWYAWRQNDPDQREARKNVSFESFMQKVGQGEVKILLPIDDMHDPDNYKEVLTEVDISKFRGVVLVHNKENLLFKDMRGLEPRGGAVGVHLFDNGEWEIWTNYPEPPVDNIIGKINDVAYYLALGYNYLSSHGYANPGEYNDGTIFDNLNALKMYRLDGATLP